jgi:hypothetical protein
MFEFITFKNKLEYDEDLKFCLSEAEKITLHNINKWAELLSLISKPVYVDIVEPFVEGFLLSDYSLDENSNLYVNGPNKIYLSDVLSVIDKLDLTSLDDYNCNNSYLRKNDLLNINDNANEINDKIHMAEQLYSNDIMSFKITDKIKILNLRDIIDICRDYEDDEMLKLDLNKLLNTYVKLTTYKERPIVKIKEFGKLEPIYYDDGTETNCKFKYNILTIEKKNNLPIVYEVHFDYILIESEFKIYSNDKN